MFERLESNLKIQINSYQPKESNRSKVRIQDLSELEFHSRRLAHVLYVHRYSLLNKTVQREDLQQGIQKLILKRCTYIDSSGDGYTCILLTADGGFNAALYLFNVKLM